MKIVDEPVKIGEHHVLERTFITGEGYFGVCIFTELFHRCGHVGLPPNHQLHGVYYADLDFLIEVHGGLTFSSPIDRLGADDYWFFGFDCGHNGDNQDTVSGKLYGLTACYTNNFPGVVRTLDYVIEEVKSLSKQLTPQAIMRAKIENS